jgi:acyl carrier protein
MQQDDMVRLQSLFRAVFELPESRDVTTLRQTDEAAWDSLGHATLVAALESEFGVSIDSFEALKMISFEATRAILSEKSG